MEVPTGPEASTSPLLSDGPGAGAWLVYDGECPFCAMYVRHLRVADAAGGLHLVDARAGGAIVEAVAARGYNLDQGMVLKLEDRFYHGAECMHVLAVMGTRSVAFNRINAALFSSPRLSWMLYPLLRAGRNLALRLLRRRRLSPPRHPPGA